MIFVLRLLIRSLVAGLSTRSDLIAPVSMKGDGALALNREFLWDPARHEPEFADLLHRVGLDP